MKKQIIGLLIFNLCVLIHGKALDSIQVDVNHVDYNLDIIVPLGESDVIECSTRKTIFISDATYREIKKILMQRHRQKTTYVSDGYDLSFMDAEFSLKYGDDNFTSEKTLQLKKINMSDYNLDVRYVIVIRPKRGKIKLLIGKSVNVIGYNGIFYSLPENDFNRLVEIADSFVK